MIRPSAIGIALAAALGLVSSGANAQGVNAGVLECHGIVRKWGVDIGVTEASVLAWGVVAPTARIGPGDLAGTYGGVSAGAAVVVGAGANALIGGSGNTIALQPVSVEGQTG